MQPPPRPAGAAARITSQPEGGGGGMRVSSSARSVARKWRHTSATSSWPRRAGKALAPRWRLRFLLSQRGRSAGRWCSAALPYPPPSALWPRRSRRFCLSMLFPAYHLSIPGRDGGKDGFAVAGGNGQCGPAVSSRRAPWAASSGARGRVRAPSSAPTWSTGRARPSSAPSTSPRGMATSRASWR